MFIWSYFQYYSTLASKSESNARSIKASLEKSENLLGSLNEPFSIATFENMQSGDYMIRDTSKSKLQKNEVSNSVNVKSGFNNNNVNVKSTNSVDKYIYDRTDNFIKEKLSK